MRNVIVNADDFGLNASVNNAIVECFCADFINSTTIMANMPGFEEAVHLAHQYKFKTKIGAHLVLTEGSPLTEQIRSVNYLYNKNAGSKKKLGFKSFILNKVTEELIFNEFEAQINKIKTSGIPITHLDTHHHIHQYFGIARILVRLKNKYNIPFIRILNNLEEPSRMHKKLYRLMINFYLKKEQANYSDLFGNQMDALKKIEFFPALLETRNIEIMVHPDYDLQGKLIDKIGNKSLDFKFTNSLIVNSHHQA